MKRIEFIDFDGTIANSPEPLEGKKIWEEKKGKKYPHIGWWSKTESLDIEVFDIKPFPKLMEIVNKAKGDPNTLVVILTNRLEKLRPEIERIIASNNIQVDKLDMKWGREMTKGDRILKYLDEYDDIEEINAYDDRSGDLHDLMGISGELEKEGIKYRIFKADNGMITLIHESKTINEIINNEIDDFLEKKYN